MQMQVSNLFAKLSQTEGLQLSSEVIQPLGVFLLLVNELVLGLVHPLLHGLPEGGGLLHGAVWVGAGGVGPGLCCQGLLEVLGDAVCGS